MIYDVWDSESANIVGAFASQDEALDALGRALSDHGTTYVSFLVLGIEEDAGDSTMLATGTGLVRMVEEHVDSCSDRLARVEVGPLADEPVHSGLSRG